MTTPRAGASAPSRRQRLLAWAIGWNGRKKDPKPVFKQVFYVAIPMLVATVLSLIVGQEVNASPFEMVGVIALFLAALAASIVLSVKPALARWEPVPPALDLLGIGAVSVVGSNPDIYVAVMVLPVVWIASIPGRRHVAIAFGSTAAAVLMPHILGRDTFDSVAEIIHDLFPAMVLLFVAVITNVMSSQLTKQFVELEALAEQQDELLVKSLVASAHLQQSEAKLRASGRMFRSVWTAVTEQSVIGTDLNGAIEAWGPGATKLLGLTEEEAQHHHVITDFHVRSELDELVRKLGLPAGGSGANPGFSALVETARQGHADSGDWTYVRADGAELPVQLTVTARRDDADTINGYLFVAIDQTQAREVSRLKDEFVGLISHELRTPLSSVLGYLELMRDDEEHPLSDEQQQYLGVAERNAKRLLRLVGDLLFTAQVESGKFSLETRHIDLAPLVLASIETAGPAAASAGVTLIADPGSSSVIVNGDVVRLGQSIDNLISNAVKFTPSGGSVTVSLDAGDRDAIITVRDTGYGIPPDELEKLFGRFFRASTATKIAVPGVGLGLAITQAIVTAHGGRITVDSQVDEGTGFVVTLPLLAHRAPVAGALVG